MNWIEPCVRTESHQGNDPLWPYEYAKSVLMSTHYDIKLANKAWQALVKKYDLD